MITFVLDIAGGKVETFGARQQVILELGQAFLVRHFHTLGVLLGREPSSLTKYRDLNNTLIRILFSVTVYLEMDFYRVVEALGKIEYCAQVFFHDLTIDLPLAAHKHVLGECPRPTQNGHVLESWLENHFGTLFSRFRVGLN